MECLANIVETTTIYSGLHFMDRSQLLLRSLARLGDHAIEEFKKEIATFRKDGPAFGAMDSEWIIGSMSDSCCANFSKACVSLFDKFQLEQSNITPDMAKEVKLKTIEPLKKRFIATLFNEANNYQGLISTDLNRRQFSATESDLILGMNRIQENIFEEFQLAASRYIQPQAITNHHNMFIENNRIESLRTKNSSGLDYSRLICLCNEINIAWSHNAYHSVAMLCRAIIDHVPPIFHCRNFAEVANNYPGSKSFRDTMKHLDTTSRYVADAHLHTQIRDREVIPTSNQVDFRSAIDVLLAEIDRTAS